MEADSGIHLSSLKADGGASANNLLMQMQADISMAPVNRPVCVETTAMGAAYLAGLSVGYWKDKALGIRPDFYTRINRRNKKRKNTNVEKSSPMLFRVVWHYLVLHLDRN